MEPMPAATAPAAQPAPWREVFRGRNGRLVVGLLLFETLGAIHLLIVSTVMPAVLSDLGNLTLYGWAGDELSPEVEAAMVSWLDGHPNIGS